jgi:hypothetical protein
MSEIESHLSLERREIENHTDIREQIIQYEIELVRTNDKTRINQLANTLDGLLSTFATMDKETRLQQKEQIIVLYKLIGKTRDIQFGKGEYALANMMVWVWYKYYPTLAKFALSTFVHLPSIDPAIHLSYGSWKDIKYFCNYAREQGATIDHPLIQYAILLANTQLRKDVAIANTPELHSSNKVSLVAKWINRETSRKFGWLYETMATNYYPEYLQSAKTNESREKAIKKCKTLYRITLADLNRFLDTIQIKQCSNRWAFIDHTKTTSITMNKQRNALLNMNSSPRDMEMKTNRYANQKYNKQPVNHTLDPDRIKCAEKFRTHIDTQIECVINNKRPRLYLETFASDATRWTSHQIYGGDQAGELTRELDILNEQWCDNAKNNTGHKNMVAMISTANSMYKNPYNVAVTLGCNIAEQSNLGKQSMTFSENPRWIDLATNNTFTSMIDIIKKESEAGHSANLCRGLELLLESIESKRLNSDEVENLTLVVLTDMDFVENLLLNVIGQVNAQNTEDMIEATAEWRIMYERMRTKYAESGIQQCGNAYPLPHILVWNLRGKNTYPTYSIIEPKISCISGYNQYILEDFGKLGINALKNLTPWNILQRTLENERYLPLDAAIQSELFLSSSSTSEQSMSSSI